MFHITDECIECSLCEPLCPVSAISHGEGPFHIGGGCNDCQGKSQPLCVEVCPVECILKIHSLEEFSVGLSSNDPDVRLSFARGIVSSAPSPAVIESGLTDPVSEIRAAVSARTDYVPNAIQIERALVDVDGKVRLAMSSRSDIILNVRQIERALCDSDPAVRQAIATRRDFTPTANQLERGLTDSHPYVRCAFAKRTDCNFSDSQIGRGLNDSVLYVQEEFSRHRPRSSTMGNE